MTIWLLIVVLAHLFYAMIFIIDKYIVSRPLPHPIVYTFYVGVLSIFIWVLIPFGFSFPSFNYILWSILAGIVQVGSLIFFYKALNLGEVSRMVPFVGSFVAIFTLSLSTFLIAERLTTEQYIAFILLVLGSFIISYKKRYIFQRAFGLAILSALLSAVFWVITKYIFSASSFISGAVWVRTGVAIASLFLLLSKNNRRLILEKTGEIKLKTVLFFSGGRGLSIVAGFFMYLAVFLGSVTLSNSLQGLQYAFILILALLFFRKIPSLREEFSREIIIQKIIAIIFISLGLFILII